MIVNNYKKLNINKWFQLQLDSFLCYDKSINIFNMLIFHILMIFFNHLNLFQTDFYL